jgi:hypothetical protein
MMEVAYSPVSHVTMETMLQLKMNGMLIAFVRVSQLAAQNQRLVTTMPLLILMMEAATFLATPATMGTCSPTTMYTVPIAFAQVKKLQA